MHARIQEFKSNSIFLHLEKDSLEKNEFNLPLFFSYNHYDTMIHEFINIVNVHRENFILYYCIIKSFIVFFEKLK